MCKRSMVSLGIPWEMNCPRPSRWQGNSKTQFLKEVTVSWKRNFIPVSPYSRNILSFDGKIPAFFPCQPWSHWWQNTKMPVTASRLPSHLTKTDRFQSAIIEQTYKVEAMAVWAHNVDDSLWDDITNTDICVPVFLFQNLFPVPI